MTRLPKKLEVLGEPDYRRLFLGRTASLIGDGISPIAIAFAVLDLTGSPTDLGLVLAANSLPLSALILAGGVWADRLSPRVAMIGSDLVRAVAMGLIALLLISGAAEIWHLAVLYAIEGAATAFFYPASAAIVPQVVPGDRLQDANALLNLSRHSGKVAGPALAGILLALGSPGTALAVDAATFAISAACLVGMRTARPRNAAGESSFLSELRHGWREFSRRSWMIAVVLSAALSNLIFWPAFQVLGPTIADDALGGSSSWALIAALWGAGGLIGGGLALVARPRHPLLVTESLIVFFALPVALLAVPAPALLIALGALLAGAASGLAEVFWETLAAQHVPEESLSRVMAYDWFGSLALEPVGLALIGPLAAGVGTSTTLWISAVVILACQAAVLSVPGVRRLEYR